MKFDTLLTLDGGGLRALMTNQILKEVEKSIKEYFLEHRELLPVNTTVESLDDIEVHLANFFDCMAGVSGGSWVALYYASKGGNGASGRFLSRQSIVRTYGRHAPGSASGLDVFFLEFGGRIYPSGIRHQLPSVRLGWFPFNLPGINSPRYPIRGLEEGLRAIYGDTKMSELSTNCIINAYDINRRTPVLFTYNNGSGTPVTSATVVMSRSAPIHSKSRAVEGGYEADLDIHVGEDFSIADVARASSALPAFHMAKEMSPIDNDTVSYSCIDGAVVGPNPILHSMNFVLRNHGRYANLFRIATLSLGTGYTLGQWSENVNRGIIGWMLTGDLLRIITDGGSEALQSNIDFLLYSSLRFPPGQYLRIQVFAERETSEGDALSVFDDASTLKVLRKIGRQAAEKLHRKQIKKFLEEFVFASENVTSTPGAFEMKT